MSSIVYTLSFIHGSDFENPTRNKRVAKQNNQPIRTLLNWNASNVCYLTFSWTCPDDRARLLISLCVAVHSRNSTGSSPFEWCVYKNRWLCEHNTHTSKYFVLLPNITRTWVYITAMVWRSKKKEKKKNCWMVYSVYAYEVCITIYTIHTNNKAAAAKQKPNLTYW